MISDQSSAKVGILHIAEHQSKFKDGDDVPPLVIGFSAPQGCGKSTLVFAQDYLFKTTKRKSATISVDDFYLTAKGQVIYYVIWTNRSEEQVRQKLYGQEDFSRDYACAVVRSVSRNSQMCGGGCSRATGGDSAACIEHRRSCGDMPSSSFSFFLYQKPQEHTGEYGAKEEVLEAVLKETVDLENVPIEKVFESLRGSRECLTTQAAYARFALFEHNKLEEKKVRLLYV